MLEGNVVKIFHCWGSGIPAPFLSINNALLQHQIIVHSNIADIAVKYLKLFLETTFLRNFILRRVNESLILYCSQEKETVPRRIDILCVSERNQCSSILKRTGAILFSREENRWFNFMFIIIISGSALDYNNPVNITCSTLKSLYTLHRCLFAPKRSRFTTLAILWLCNSYTSITTSTISFMIDIQYFQIQPHVE